MFAQPANAAHGAGLEFERALAGLAGGAGILHAGETGLRAGGKLHRLHVMCAAWPTLYRVREKRGREAVDDIGVLAGCYGRLVNYYWKSYLGYLCERGFCNAHQLGEPTFLAEESRTRRGRPTRSSRWSRCRVSGAGSRRARR